MILHRLNKIVLATHNRHKAQEIRSVLADLAGALLTLDDFPEIGEIPETGKTLEENAIIKAETVHKKTGLPAIADDTGLEVAALNGAPGVFSARYAGENATFDDNINRLLTELEPFDMEQRQARFRTVIAFINNEKPILAEGSVNGYIARDKTGTGGFGYDPVFWVPELKRTFAQLSEAEKNAVSHRGKALRNLRNLLN